MFSMASARLADFTGASAPCRSTGSLAARQMSMSAMGMVRCYHRELPKGSAGMQPMTRRRRIPVYETKPAPEERPDGWGAW